MLAIEDPNLEDWIPQLATNLTHTGVTGTLTGAHLGLNPPWLQELQMRPWGHVQLAYLPDYTLLRPKKHHPDQHILPGPGWHAAPGTAEPVAAYLTQQVTALGTDLQITIDGGHIRMPTTPADAPDLMVKHVERDSGVTLYAYDHPRHLRLTATLDREALAGLQMASDQAPTPADLDTLRHLMTTAPRHNLQSATITPEHTYLPPGLNKTYSMTPGNRSRYVLAPGWAQILTTEHLDHAHNLSRWTITHLDNHHHLVETTNHTGWHLPTPPWIDPNVMNQALDDFGDIILPAPPPPDFPS